MYSIHLRTDKSADLLRADDDKSVVVGSIYFEQEDATTAEVATTDGNVYRFRDCKSCQDAVTKFAALEIRFEELGGIAA